MPTIHLELTQTQNGRHSRMSLRISDCGMDISIAIRSVCSTSIAHPRRRKRDDQESSHRTTERTFGIISTYPSAGRLS